MILEGAIAMTLGAEIETRGSTRLDLRSVPTRYIVTTLDETPVPSGLSFSLESPTAYVAPPSHVEQLVRTAALLTRSLAFLPIDPAADDALDEILARQLGGGVKRPLPKKGK